MEVEITRPPGRLPLILYFLSVISSLNTECSLSEMLFQCTIIMSSTPLAVQMLSSVVLFKKKKKNERDKLGLTMTYLLHYDDLKL